MEGRRSIRPDTLQTSLTIGFRHLLELHKEIMLCLVIRHADSELVFPIPEGESCLGSDPSCEFAVPFPGASRRHARLMRQGPRVHIEDAGSKNGLWINRRRIKKTDLQPGTEVLIGKARLTVQDIDRSEVLLGLELPDLAPGITPEAASTHSVLPSFADLDEEAVGSVVRFLRKLEAGKLGIHQAIEDCRKILGASGVLLFASGKEWSILSLSGSFGPELPESLLMRTLGPWIEVSSGRILVCRQETGGVAAFFPSSALKKTWFVDFLEIVASRVPATKVRVQTPDPPGDEPDPLPAGFVSGESHSMKTLLDETRVAARSPLDILLQGETGTGKEILARLVHDWSPVRGAPFVPVNCAAIPAELLESELFGVQGRVATGVDPRPGLILAAAGGTLFLDEVGELAGPLQAKLLRFLQEREVHPLGARQPRRIDVRVISASNRDLREEVHAGRFRADLFFRLNGICLTIPPLRERKEDIPELALLFLRDAAGKQKKPIAGVSEKALRALMEYRWPGNVRELKMAINRACVLCKALGSVQSEHLGLPVVPKPASAPSLTPAGESAETLNLQDRVDAVERLAIEEALAAAKGNKSLAARLLGVTRTGLAMKMRRLFGVGPKSET